MGNRGKPNVYLACVRTVTLAFTEKEPLTWNESPVVMRITGLVATLQIIGCASTPSAEPWQACIASPNEACVLGLAERSLDNIEEDQSWINAATEVALAQKAAGRDDQARSVLEEAQRRSNNIDDPTDRLDGLVDVAKTMSKTGAKDTARNVLMDAQPLLQRIADTESRWDRLGKLAAAISEAGFAREGLQLALGMPEGTPNQASFKARTLSEIAFQQMSQHGLDAGLGTLSGIDMGLPYYQSTIRSRMARTLLSEYANEAGRLAAEAEEIARAQKDGYFSAGALRQVARFEFDRGESTRGLELYVEAAKLAATAGTAQERARATSRVAAALADNREYPTAAQVVESAVLLAQEEQNEALRHWSFYEIAGSAAFCGDFNTAYRLLDEIPESTMLSGKSVKSAAQRDVAWGLVRHGRTREALGLANEMVSHREKAQALARIVRLMRNSAMPALPRYL